MTSEAWLLGPGDDAGFGELARGFELGARAPPTRRPRAGSPTRGARAQPARVAKRGSSLPLRMADEVAEVPELVLAHDLRDDVAVGRTEALADHLRAPCSGSGRTPSDQKFVTMSVIATIASNIAMSTYWPRPVCSRWRSAARMPITPNSAELMSPSAPTGIVTGGDVGMAVVVDARHRLDDRRVRGPVAVRRLDRVAEAGDRHVDRPRVERRRSRRSRAPCGPWSRA